MRVSEFTSHLISDDFSPLGLHWSDVQLCTFSIIIIVCQSKTDIFQRSHSFAITATNTSTCPVRSMYHYFNLVPPGNQSGPLFSGGRFSPLSRAHVTSVMRQLLQATGVTPFHYSSHSFRIGAATTLAAAGLPATLIKAMGQWKSHAYESYVQFPPSSLDAVSSILAHTDADA